MSHDHKPCLLRAYYASEAFPDAPEGSPEMIAYDAAAPRCDCTRCQKDRKDALAINAHDALVAAAERAITQILALSQNPNDPIPAVRQLYAALALAKGDKS